MGSATAPTMAPKDRFVLPGYVLAIYDRSSDWTSWRPKSLDDCPPLSYSERGEVLPRQVPLPDLYAELLKLNGQFQAHGLNRWAVICERPVSEFGRMRDVTPFTYRSLSVMVDVEYEPAHLLDVPNRLWTDDDASDTTLAEALEETLSINRLRFESKDLAHVREFWRIVIAIENDGISSSDYLTVDLSGRGGVHAEHKMRRFHVVTPDWPGLEGADLELPTVEGGAA